MENYACWISSKHETKNEQSVLRYNWVSLKHRKKGSDKGYVLAYSIEVKDLF